MYTVKRGDSLYSISKNYNVSVDDIKKLNNLTSNILQVGQVLKIPGGSNSNYITYTVKPGDTVYGISSQFGVSAIDISTLNNLGGSNIKVGQVLKIPNNTGTNPESMFIYTVEKGDSLYSIARRYETTVDEIIKLNKLSNNNLQVGQKLRIPENGMIVTEPPSYTIYTVVKGDNIYSIARKFNTTVDDIKRDNNLKSDTLSIGQTLKIKTKDNEKVEECFGEEYIPDTKAKTYIVQKGDSLYRIAKKFNTSVTNILNKNNLTSNTLQIGQKLTI